MWCLIKHLILRLQHCKFFTSYERVRPWLNVHSLTTRKELLLVCHKINCHLQQGKLWICVYDWLLTYLGYFYISVIYMLLCLRISPARKRVSKSHGIHSLSFPSTVHHKVLIGSQRNDAMTRKENHRSWSHQLNTIRIINTEKRNLQTISHRGWHTEVSKVSQNVNPWLD